jgi:hypothetical protein
MIWLQSVSPVIVDVYTEERPIAVNVGPTEVKINTEALRGVADGAALIAQASQPPPPPAACHLVFAIIDAFDAVKSVNECMGSVCTVAGLIM